MKQINAIEIRPMQLGDILVVAKIHKESFPLSRSTRLGMPFLTKMYEWYVTYQPGLSFVAVRDNVIVGFVTGTKGRESHRRRFKYAIWQVIWGVIRTPTVLFSAEVIASGKTYLKGFFSIQQKMPPPILGKPAYVKVTLDSIAVHITARKTSVGCALISTFEKAGAQHNASFLTLGVEYDNHAARNLYEKCGWRVSNKDRSQNDAHYVKDISEIEREILL